MTNPESETIMHQDDLPALAREVRTEAQMTQQEVADKLGVTKASVSRAERIPSGSYLNLQKRILSEIGGFKLEGPLWRVS